RRRLREMAGTHVRYGYRRLTVLLRREGWHVNAKRIYRLYREEGLIVRTKQRRKMARRRPVPEKRITLRVLPRSLVAARPPTETNVRRGAALGPKSSDAAKRGSIVKR
ncbi:MAG: IS3 family transposase, partial [Acidobacteriia bacterium]|nr:IS3 family transposase [Terriglobia bacterium]